MSLGCVLHTESGRSGEKMHPAGGFSTSRNHVVALAFVNELKMNIRRPERLRSAPF